MSAPPGVVRAGFAFLLGAVFFAYAFVLRVAPSVMVSELMSAFAVGGAILGNLSAFYFYAYSGLQIPVGLLLDRFGVQRLMAAAALVVGGGTYLFASATSIESAYVGRLLIGAGCAFSWAGTLALVNQWFPNRFAVLAGASQMVAMGGAVLGQAPLSLFVQDFGWRETNHGLAIIGLALGVLIFIVTRDKPTSAAPPASTAESSSSGRSHVLRNPQTWLAAWVGLAMTSPMLAFGALWGVPYLETAHDLHGTEAAGIASLIFLGNGVGGLLLGWISDRVGNRKIPMLAGASLCVAAQLAFLLPESLSKSTLIALIFLSGVGGSTMVLAFAVGREQNSLAHAGLTIGIINAAVTGSGALLQPAIGWFLDLGWDGSLENGARVYSAEVFRDAMLTVPAVGCLGLLGILFIRETHARQTPAP